MRAVCGITVAVACLICCFAAAASAESAVGTVLNVEKWTLTIRTEGGKTVEINPYLVKTGSTWVPRKPAAELLAALEAGERVDVTWTLDTSEKQPRNRIDVIAIVSPSEGVTKELWFHQRLLSSSSTRGRSLAR